MWSDPRLIDAARSFVPAADEVYRLQGGSDPECQFFQRAVNGGELITDRGSRQGIWIFSPSGVRLASINSNSPGRVLEVLEQGLAAWDALSDEERDALPEQSPRPVHRWEYSFPEDGLVLSRVARDVARGDPASEPIAPWNRDFAWFTRDEARAWLPADPRVGDVHAVPAVSVRRLARFHLVDNVRGQTLPFADIEVLAACLTSEVTGRAGERVEIELRGRTNARADGAWLLGQNLWKPRHEHPHGIETRLVGTASYDLAARRFVAFELVALGKRWGRTHMNGRRNDLERSGIGFHFALAGGAPRVAPTFIAVYDAPWVQPSVDR